MVATLLAPPHGADNLTGNVTFQWSYPRPLAQHEAFQVLAWKAGNPHWGIAGLTGETQQTINLDIVLSERGGAGEYFWTVVVREISTEKQLSPETSPWSFTFGAPDPCDACDCQDNCRSGNCNPCCDQCCGGCK